MSTAFTQEELTCRAALDEALLEFQKAADSMAALVSTASDAELRSVLVALDAARATEGALRHAVVQTGAIALLYKPYNRKVNAVFAGQTQALFDAVISHGNRATELLGTPKPALATSLKAVMAKLQASCAEVAK